MQIYPKLSKVEPMDDYRLLLTFDNGERKIYDFSPNLKSAYYTNLKDIRLFKSVVVRNGEIEWVTGQDFCPHTLYEKSLPNEL
jgi:hypothetical protein